MMSNISLDEAIEAKENAEQEIGKILKRLIELGLSVKDVDIAVLGREFGINGGPIVEVRIQVTL